MLGLLHQTHTHTHGDTDTHLTKTPSGQCASSVPLIVLEKIVARAHFFAKRPTYCNHLEAAAGTTWSESWVHVCLFHHCTEDLSKKHVLLLNRQDVLSSVTYTFLSVNPSQTHTHTQTHTLTRVRTNSVSVEAVCQAQKKKKKISTDRIC